MFVCKYVKGNSAYSMSVSGEIKVSDILKLTCCCYSKVYVTIYCIMSDRDKNNSTDVCFREVVLETHSLGGNFWWQSWVIDMLSGGSRRWSKQWNFTIELATTSRWWMLTERCWPTSSQLLHAITAKNASTTSLTLCQMVLTRTWSCFRSSIRQLWRLWRKPKMRSICHPNDSLTESLVLLNLFQSA